MTNLDIIRAVVVADLASDPVMALDVEDLTGLDSAVRRNVGVPAVHEALLLVSRLGRVDGDDGLVLLGLHGWWKIECRGEGVGTRTRPAPS